MKLRSHIRIAKNTLDILQSQVDWKVNKVAYMIGSISPDLNCALPCHNIKSTIKRFRKRIERINKHNPGIIQSFTLGVVMHYICDYFCFAHNIDKIVPGHAIYEVYLQKHIVKQKELLVNNNSELIEQWNEIYSHLNDAVNNEDNKYEIMDTFTKDSADHIDKIVSMVIKMNEIYLDKVDIDLSDNWTSGGWRLEIDTLFSTLMCEKVALEIFSVIS